MENPVVNTGTPSDNFSLRFVKLKLIIKSRFRVVIKVNSYLCISLLTKAYGGFSYIGLEVAAWHTSLGLKSSLSKWLIVFCIELPEK